MNEDASMGERRGDEVSVDMDRGGRGVEGSEP